MTGLELSLYERAGYILRRGFLTPQAIVELRRESEAPGAADALLLLPHLQAINSLARDLLGERAREVAARIDSGVTDTSWTRQEGPAPGEEPNRQTLELLQAPCGAATALIPLTGSFRVRLLPGSHLQGFDCPGEDESTALTLAEGDLLLLDPRVARSELPGATRLLRVRFARPTP